MELLSLSETLIVLFVLFHKRLIVSSTCVADSKDAFLIHPRDQIIREGENASFTCSVPNFNPNLDSLTWDIVDDIYPTYFVEKLNENTSVLTSNVVVHNGGDETQFFRCKLARGFSGCYFSQRARTIVQNFPSQNEVTCQPQIPMPFEIGDTITIKCSSPKGKPAVDMDFILEEPISFSFPQPKRTDTTTTRTVAQDLIVTADLHNTNIICQVTSGSAFPNRALHCPVGPFIVYHQPRVRVQPPVLVLRHIGDPISVSCIATGYPDIFSFFWACFPQGYLEDCNIRSSQLNLNVNCSLVSNPIDVEVTVTCSATNDRGPAYNTSKIMILSSVWDQCRSLPTTANAPIRLMDQIHSNGYLRIEQRYTNYTRDQQLMVQIACTFISSVENIDRIGYELDCYFGQQLLRPDDTEIRAGSVLTFMIPKIPPSGTVPSVTCIANTTFGLYEQQINISLNYSLFAASTVPIPITNFEDNTTTFINQILKYKFVFIVVGAIFLIMFICVIVVFYLILHNRFRNWTRQASESERSEIHIPDRINRDVRNGDNLSIISDSAYEVPIAFVTNEKTQTQIDETETTIIFDTYSSYSESQSETKSISSDN